ncbi:MAG: ABC transporter ATP-binding protein [Alphaproteobacteria bacterium]|nr:ABC transporter ATP-binding protein [Alphaproteobacteria bacterium]
MAGIEAHALTIEFPLYHHNARSLKRRIFDGATRRVKQHAESRVVVAALADLNFLIGKGDRVALIGSNGAGKTTLLRTIAGIYEPVAGQLMVEGTIGSLIDPGAGMNPLLTGRENIVLRGLYRGLTEREGRSLADEVAEFSGLGEFIDLPIRGYSAGMNVRLSFAMATAMTPEILLMDEWFLASDADFMAKAEARLTRLVTGADILVIATHDMAIVRKWCTRAIKLDAGRIIADGSVAEVLGPAD